MLELGCKIAKKRRFAVVKLYSVFDYNNRLCVVNSLVISIGTLFIYKHYRRMTVIARRAMSYVASAITM